MMCKTMRPRATCRGHGPYVRGYLADRGSPAEGVPPDPATRVQVPFSDSALDTNIDESSSQPRTLELSQQHSSSSLSSVLKNPIETLLSYEEPLSPATAIPAITTTAMAKLSSAFAWNARYFFE